MGRAGRTPARPILSHSSTAAYRKKKACTAMKQQSFPWVSFYILMGMGGIALFLALPRPLQPAYFIISLALLGVLVGAGLFLSRNAGLNPLFLMRDPPGSRLQKLIRVFGRATLVGIGLGTFILAAIYFLPPYLLPEIQLRFSAEANIALWKRAVIAFDSAVLEEYVFRLFLFSFLIWLAGKIRLTQKPPSPKILWGINALIAIGFGMAHLPQWYTMTPLTPPIILTVVFLNSLGGLAFGFLYFENGLEAAMLAHFWADIVLHVIGPGYLHA